MCGTAWLAEHSFAAIAPPSYCFWISRSVAGGICCFSYGIDKA
jgi:hypothetical protein